MSLDLRKWGIGFDDQLWWQAETGAQLDTAPSLVFVDEYQDTNQPQAEMVRKLIDAGSRVVVVGDERQAIFGFRGADTRAMDNGEVLLRGTDDRGLTVLPLTQTRRCSEMVVRLTQAIVPDFECLPGTASNYGDEAAQFGTALRDWYMAKRKPLLMEGDDAERRLATLQDQYDCLNILAMEGMDAGKIKNTIRFVFGDGARNGKVTLSTGHKFKGLEVETVDNRLVLLRPDRLGMAGRNDEDTMQESNVLNVMLTRAKGGLYFVPYITKKGKEVQVPQVLEGRWMELIAETLQLKEDN
jgi:superfamily I DNA/RNA helicase